MEFSFDGLFEHKFVLMSFFLFFQMLCFLVLRIFWGPFFYRIFNAIEIFRSRSVMVFVETL